MCMIHFLRTPLRAIVFHCKASLYPSRKFHGCSELLHLLKNYSHKFKICAESQSVLQGKALHAYVTKTIPQPEIFVANSAVNFYFKCGCIVDAIKMFDEIMIPDVVSWNTVINGLCQAGLVDIASCLFKKMILCGKVPDQVSFVSLLKGCIEFGCLCMGLQLHSTLIKFGLGDDVVIGSGLLELYCSFGYLEEPVKVYNGLVLKDTVLINTMMCVFLRLGKYQEVFYCFWQILSLSLKPTRASFVSLLNAVDRNEFMMVGLQIHGSLLKFGFDADGAVENSLISMYASCDMMDTAFSLLLSSGSRNIMSWTSLITGYVRLGFLEDAMRAFYWFYKNFHSIDSVLLSCILGVSAATDSLYLGCQIHSVALKSGLLAEPFVRDSLMEMYAKCFCMEDALGIFNLTSDNCDLHSWTILISGYVHNGCPTEALNCFCFMRRAGISLDSVAFTTVLLGCIDRMDIINGEQIHGYIMKYGSLSNILVQTSLLSLYAESGFLSSALSLFDATTMQDVVAWTALMSGYMKHGLGERALTLFLKMLQHGIKPNHFTLATIIAACAEQTAVVTGKLLHAFTIKTGYEGFKFVDSALIDMYSKCGAIKDSIQYFRLAPKFDVAIWNALLAGYAFHGNGIEVLKTFEIMQKHRVSPDEVTFLSVLSGCSHGGLAIKVLHYFEMMFGLYKIKPNVDHYSCVIDAFGRAGLFGSAIEFIKVTGIGNILVVLRTLLGSCITHSCMKLGPAVAAKILILGEADPGTYILISNLLSTDEKWVEAKRVRDMMERPGFGRKKIGQTWIGEG